LEVEPKRETLDYSNNLIKSRFEFTSNSAFGVADKNLSFYGVVKRVLGALGVCLSLKGEFRSAIKTKILIRNPQGCYNGGAFCLATLFGRANRVAPVAASDNVKTETIFESDYKIKFIWDANVPRQAAYLQEISMLDIPQEKRPT